jgi:hypothetical protein
VRRHVLSLSQGFGTFHVPMANGVAQRNQCNSPDWHEIPVDPAARRSAAAWLLAVGTMDRPRPSEGVKHCRQRVRYRVVPYLFAHRASAMLDSASGFERPLVGHPDRPRVSSGDGMLLTCYLIYCGGTSMEK